MAGPGALTIGNLARRLELNPRTIRFYEQAGVIPEPARTRAGYRLYSPEDEERLRFVKSAQRLGLTLGEIKEVLALRERGERPCRYVGDLIERRLAEIDARMQELRALKQELSVLRKRMEADGLPEREGSFCHYVETAPAASRRRVAPPDGRRPAGSSAPLTPAG